ncbi:hypothetical protein HDV00_004266 [Rhizophlyctis rosea]|nr:hypothetical protein HDV00_004266 [Rhizophlyctis rosea]
MSKSHAFAEGGKKKEEGEMGSGNVRKEHPPTYMFSLDRRYDSHREAILRGDDEADIGSGGSGYVDVTTTDTLMRFFTASCYKGYTDTDPKSFYQTYRELFARLEHEEEEALTVDTEASHDQSDSITFTDFGSSSTPYDPQLREFYNKFLYFTSVKSFRWYDKYRLSDAPDRRIRRLMETENKKLRTQAKKEFVEAVRQLAEFVRKRDPRYKDFQEAQRKATEEKIAAEKRRVAKEKRERALKAQEYEAPEWAKVREDDDEVEDLVAEEYDELFCVACNKGFKSERQFENHGKSKKHLRMVELLREELLADEEGGDLGSDEGDEDGEEGEEEEEDGELSVEVDGDEGEEDDVNADDVDDVDAFASIGDDDDALQPALDTDSDATPSTPTFTTRKKKKQQQRRQRSGLVQSESDVDPHHEDDHSIPAIPTTQNGTQYTLEDPLVDSIINSLKEANVSSDDDNASTTGKGGKKKKGKAKERKAAREAAKASSSSVAAEECGATTQWKCNVCREEFGTRNKLFDHIRRTGHALAGAGEVGERWGEEVGGGKKGKKKGRR